MQPHKGYDIFGQVEIKPAGREKESCWKVQKGERERAEERTFCVLCLCVEGGGGVALQSHPLRHPAHAGRHDVHRQHPQPLRHQHRQVESPSATHSLLTAWLSFEPTLYQNAIVCPAGNLVNDWWLSLPWFWSLADPSCWAPVESVFNWPEICLGF